MPDRPKNNPIKSRNRVLGKSNPFPSLPEGGKTGEVLVKTSDETGEVDWGVVQGDGSVTPPFDPTYLEEKDAEQDKRLDDLEAVPPPPPFDDSALKLKDSQQDDRMDDLEAEDQSQDARISDLESIDPFDPTALIEKDEEQDDRLDALEAAPPGGGGTDYDDTAIWESQAEQDERLDLLEQMGGDADLWGTYKCQSSSSAPMAGQIRALPQDDKAVNIEWFFIHNETLNGNGLPLDEIDPGEHIRLTSPAGLVIDFTVTDVEDRTTYQKVTVDKAATICSDPDSLWSVYWVGQSQVVFSLKQSAQGGGSYDDTAIWQSQTVQDARLDILEDGLSNADGAGVFEGLHGQYLIRRGGSTPAYRQVYIAQDITDVSKPGSLKISEQDTVNYNKGWVHDYSSVQVGDEMRFYMSEESGRWFRWRVTSVPVYHENAGDVPYWSWDFDQGEVFESTDGVIPTGSTSGHVAVGRFVPMSGGGGADYDDTELRGLITDNADKNDEQDERLDLLEANPYDDSWIDGGSTGQVLTKASGADKDVVWRMPSTGGGAATWEDDLLLPDFKITRQYLIAFGVWGGENEWEVPEWVPGVMLRTTSYKDLDEYLEKKGDPTWGNDRGFCHPLDADGNQEPVWEWLRAARAQWAVHYPPPGQGLGAWHGKYDPLRACSYYCHNETTNDVWVYEAEWGPNGGRGNPFREATGSHYTNLHNAPVEEVGWQWFYDTQPQINYGDIITVASFRYEPPRLPGATWHR